MDATRALVAVAGDQGQPGTPGGPANPDAPQWPAQPGAPGWPAQPGAPGSSPPPSAYQPGTYPPGPYPPTAYPPGPYPPPYAYPGMPPRRSGGGWAVGVVVGIVTVLALIVCGCVGLAFLGSTMDDGSAAGTGYEEPIYGEPGDWTDDPSAPPARPATTPSGGPGKYTVLYEVTGSEGDAEVQYYDANGDFHQLNLVDSSWRLRFTTNNRERVQIVTMPGSAAGLTCRITIDGKVVSQKSGRWGVTCFGW
ncbi:MmpS family transport accessory protein [Micromonospora chalcea]|uniref:MmpS family transport accessory protein n=1 Tax=Micromonospora chalcea TaxID=1874 RepID=UPI001F2906CD|nr:MmpS family transport accessory protein [Micromonospora chalcea]